MSAHPQHEQGVEVRKRILARYRQYRRARMAPPSLTDLAGEIGISLTAARKHVLRLVEQGDLVRDDLGHGRGSYRLPETTP